MRAFITFLATAITLVILAKYSYPQTDSIVNTKNADFSLYRTSFVRYGDSKSVEKRREIFEAENINTVLFLKKDSLALIDNNYSSFSSSLNDIDKVTLKTGNIHAIAGILPGVIVGGLVGGLIGYGISSLDRGKSNDFGERMVYGFGKLAASIFGALLGAGFGGVTGNYIVNIINHETLDLSSVTNKDKKNKLIKFLRQNKKYL